MGSRPLGAMLFADRSMHREAVQVAKLPLKHEAYKYAQTDEPVWGSTFGFSVSRANRF